MRISPALNVPRMLGLRFAELRNLRGLTQEKCAELAKISPRTYARIEQGAASFREGTYAKVLRALDCTALDVVRVDNPRRRRKPGRPRKSRPA